MSNAGQPKFPNAHLSHGDFCCDKPIELLRRARAALISAKASPDDVAEFSSLFTRAPTLDDAKGIIRQWMTVGIAFDDSWGMTCFHNGYAYSYHDVGWRMFLHDDGTVSAIPYCTMHFVR